MNLPLTAFAILCVPYLTMTKNKRKGQKSRNVFHIASQKTFKVKSKAKPVTTKLKKIPQQCHENEPVNVEEATRLMAQL
ncbi:ribosomal biogenesis factor isoform X3 [Sturnira hondurensis]|uniref:ribosomal biogenesis factor isoform X3 n=1 Tax=Sturnira hondurensis TaxID=192404 RepID=UPI00187A19E5|nr:ribosomal biogenesis factor isoform X3 [Sturnira hondurensis]